MTGRLGGVQLPRELFDADTTREYLEVLGVRVAAPTLETLRVLVQAQLTRIPFENVSKLYYRKRLGLVGIPPVALYLDGVRGFGFGGTCYANNYYMYRLLEAVGFDARLCAADMTNPDAHFVCMVRVDGREYLADAGYAAPFLEPLPLDGSEDIGFALGRDRYVVRPRDERGRSRLDLYREGELAHGYTAKPEGRRLDEFRDTVLHSYRETAAFMNALLLARFFPGRAIVLHNRSLYEADGLRWDTRDLAGDDELAATVEAEFGIPGHILRDVLGDLDPAQDVWA